MPPARKRELARADKVLPGVWRLRLPLPWPGVPHVNAFAVAAGNGVVLFDTGLHEPGALGQLQAALAQAGLTLEHVRLLVCTHAHGDHYGLAAPIVEASGCELWMHPNHAHTTRAAQNPDRAFDRRIEVARQSGVPEEALNEYEKRRQGSGPGVAAVVMPDRDLLPGVEVETDLGTWQVHETPGHAPSHVVLHQPQRGLLISGDHLLGRVSLYFDFGWSPDPAGEFLRSLDVVEELDISLCLAGHGRPFRDIAAHIEGNRTEVANGLDRVLAGVDGGPVTAFDLVPGLLGTSDLTPMMVNWGLNQVLCYLTHLEARGNVTRRPGDAAAEQWVRT